MILHDDKFEPNGIPVINVKGRTLAEAYEDALICLNSKGISFPTQYDKPGDPPSLDCTANITVLEPLTDPMIHKAFPGGIADLREYVMELKGIKDEWVKDLADPKDTRWEYTYSGRLRNYGVCRFGGADVELVTPTDQVKYVIDKLAKSPFTRQAQMITWIPFLDTECYDPPCLQSLWYRLVSADVGGVPGYLLCCDVRIRSNDAWGANFMNMFGFTMFNKEIVAFELEKRLGMPVTLGRMNWQADSFHIYGKDIRDFQQRLMERVTAEKPFSDRVMNFYDEEIQEAYHEATDGVLKKVAEYRERMEKELRELKPVKACPICGMLLLAQCYHDGNEVPTVEMPAREALRIMSDTRGSIMFDLHRLEDSIRKCFREG